jgi:nucleoside-diphosphate-sugar epimerase
MSGGFIGSHMVKRLNSEGYWVCSVDLKFPRFAKTQADNFVIGDLRDQSLCRVISSPPIWAQRAISSPAGTMPT